MVGKGISLQRIAPQKKKGQESQPQTLPLKDVGMHHGALVKKATP